MQIVQARSIFRDDPLTWTRGFSVAPDFDIISYQEKLDKIAGKSRDKSILKLFWGGDSKIQKYSEWDSSGVPIVSSFVPQFALPRKNEILDVVEYIPIRRWIICERAEPEIYGYGKNDTFSDEYGRSCEVGDKPIDLYVPYIYVGDHSKCPKDCCSIKLCLGDYKAPSYDELNLILEHTYKLLSATDINPYSPMSREDMLKVEERRRKEREDKNLKLDELLDEEAKDWWNCHSHRITEDDPSVLSHGKYFFTRTK